LTWTGAGDKRVIVSCSRITGELSRRQLLKAGIVAGASALLPAGAAFAQGAPLIQRKIPSSGESLPVIGIGTARRYEDISTEAQKAPLREVLRQFKELRGKLIDTSPTYGTAEAVVGELASELKIRDALFLATKVSIEGREAGIRHRSHRGAQLARHRNAPAHAARLEAGGSHSLSRHHDLFPAAI
jgi:hypothetical protein